MVTFCAWYMVSIIAIRVLVGPFDIGKPAKPNTAQSYAVGLVVVVAPILVLVGRVLGWW